MPRRKKKARQQVYAKKIKVPIGRVKICWRLRDDGMTPGRLVAAAEWKVS